MLKVSTWCGKKQTYAQTLPQKRSIHSWICNFWTEATRFSNVLHDRQDWVVSFLARSTAVTILTGKTECLCPGLTIWRLIFALWCFISRGEEEVLIEDRSDHFSVSLETRIVGERPGDALLLVFNSPFSGLSRLYMKRDWWHKQSWLSECWCQAAVTLQNTLLAML